MFIKIILSVLIPLLVAGVNDYKKDGAIFRILITITVSNILMGIFYLGLKEAWTAYEFLFLNAESSIILDMLIFPIIKDKVLNKYLVLKVLCVASVAVVAYSVLTFGQAYIHSDIATATILSDSIIKHRNFFPKTWNYANGEIWVLNNGLFCILPTLVLNNQSLARSVGSLCFILVAIAGVVFQSKRLFKNNSWTITIPILLIYLFAGADLNQSAYTGHILWISLCSTLLFEVCSDNYSNKESRRYVGAYCILVVLLMMSGIRMLIEHSLPAWCACVCLIYFRIRDEWNSGWKTALKRLSYETYVIFIPTAIGYGIYKWICSWHNINITEVTQLVLVDSLEAVWCNIVDTILNIFNSFGYGSHAPFPSVVGLRDLISVIMCVIVCFVVPYLQWKNIGEESEAIQFFFAFGMFHNLAMIVLAVFFGKTGSRYILTTVFVWIIISSRYIYEYWISKKNLDQYVWSSLFVIATVIECIGFAMASRGWIDVVREKKEFNQELISHGLTKGYATYWNAYSNEVYSDLQISFGGVSIYENSITPFYWLVDSDVYEAEDKNTFLLLNKEENDMINYNLSNICGEPIENFIVQGMYVYVFDHDIVSDFN